ncbi:DUF2537 domain-containing protein [Nocardia stercoris]|uniref:DUF2537 domain-containing protein n=1 Tax=Nocardia stercoris TaxID=2483361 RepID=A0A3M2L5C5_9NOCA|nr:DUF2537 domain-containing protein [Nocardia stercoris]
MEAPEPTPWSAGLAVAAFVAALTAAAVYSFADALAQVNWLLAIAINVVAAVGATPTLWRWRGIRVVRWIIAGAGAGVLLGWLVTVIGNV